MPTEHKPDHEIEDDTDADDAAFQALLTQTLREVRDSNVDLPAYTPLDRALNEIGKARLEKLQLLGGAALVVALLMPWEHLIETMTTTQTSLKHLMYAAALGLIINLWLLLNDAD
ncbi:hypothetical protein [Kordiimonas sp. SCSIO 12610]|uniref:hypothetical protein n=1 Tax=Kordiimonas sp. SCSIO 12610 TaxID=2829597 RepID=UPI00210B2546|nr:hypothetical protein [Kordiimonas sp. SCSIO 12610]UTW56582.1 hypothetical protein KFF44_06700 [Kordiimonas sp. SCSIO 12610]